jgi:NitT/TauT family transport system permease protein
MPQTESNPSAPPLAAPMLAAGPHQATGRDPARHPRRGWLQGGQGLVLGLREQAPRWQFVLAGLLGIAVPLALWWYVTRGEVEERIIPPGKGLSSPWETFHSFHRLWFERALTRNLLTTMRRLGLGFGLGAVVGVPIGILCGCFMRINAFFLPLTIFGRNIPVAALIPLTVSLFGIDELQKVMFIFIACVAFVIWDTARAIGEVREAYVDSALTLGAGRWQTILKVLVPLAMPSIFNSLRLLFGLAFGYIMLAEVINSGDSGGLGNIINTSQRRGYQEDIILVLLIIPVVALVIDSLLLWFQRELFPYRYGGPGLLHKLVRAALHAWEDFKGLIWRPAVPAAFAPEPAGGTPGPRTNDQAAP